MLVWRTLKAAREIHFARDGFRPKVAYLQNLSEIEKKSFAHYYMLGPLRHVPLNIRRGVSKLKNCKKNKIKVLVDIIKTQILVHRNDILQFPLVPIFVHGFWSLHKYTQ